MMATAAQERYSTVARALHWLIALLIIANLLIGFLHEGFERPLRATLMGFHISFGITILGLSILRLVWRFVHTPPPLPAGMTPGQVLFAKLVHWVFYLLMILVPLSGWIMVSTGKFPIMWFGLFEVPKFAVEKGSFMAELTDGGHEVLAIMMAVLLVGHVIAALWHQFIVKDNIMARMR